VNAVAQGVKQLHSSSDGRERHIGAVASSGNDLGSSGTVGCCAMIRMFVEKERGVIAFCRMYLWDN